MPRSSPTLGAFSDGCDLVKVYRTPHVQVKKIDEKTRLAILKMQEKQLAKKPLQGDTLDE